MAFSMLNLTEKQVDQAADILSDIALLVTASTIVPSILLEFQIIPLIAGAVLSGIFWFTSIKIS